MTACVVGEIELADRGKVRLEFGESQSRLALLCKRIIFIPVRKLLLVWSFESDILLSL